jgi:uncharacterized repeat protein (TIGR02543 family)
MPSQNVTVYAKWEELSGIEYNVAFDLNGGFGSIDSQVVPENGTATEPSDPTRSGYRFVEWQFLGSPFNFSTTITSDITLVAVWIQQFTVSFDVDGGSAVTAQVIDNGSYAVAPDPSPTKSGSTFGGWYADGALTTAFVFPSTQITENKTIYAKWNTAIYATDLIISEYLEGSSNNKAVEIYNGTGSSVNLASYSLKFRFNTTYTWGSEITLSGTLSHGETFVVVNSSAATNMLAIADKTGTVQFNGDDAIGLFKNGVLIDIFGVFELDPGSSWTVGSGNTVDHFIIRNASAINPVSTWDVSQWTATAVTTGLGNLGSHSSNVSNP